MVDFPCWRTNRKKWTVQTPWFFFPSLRLVFRSIYTLANASAQTPSTPRARACWSSLIPLALWHYITVHDHPSLMGQTARWWNLFHPNPGWRHRRHFLPPSPALACPVHALEERMQYPDMCVRDVTRPSLWTLIFACRNSSPTYLKHLSESSATFSSPFSPSFS